ncbi:probable methyltransferase PMT1 [Tanacetum coccineum]
MELHDVSYGIEYLSESDERVSCQMLNFPKDVFNNEGNLQTILDVGCGVASFGGYLLSSDFITIIDWLQRDDILLLELDRLLRLGGYFAYSSPEAYTQDEEDLRIWKEMSALIECMCWKIDAKQNKTVIWVKPLTNDCYLERAHGTQPPLCRSNNDPDVVYGVNMEACITHYSDRKFLTSFRQRVKLCVAKTEDVLKGSSNFLLVTPNGS